MASEVTPRRTPPARHFRWAYLRLLSADVHPALLEPLCPLMERAAALEGLLAGYVARAAALANAGVGEGRHGRAERLSALTEACTGLATCKAEIAALVTEGDALVARIKISPRPVNPELRSLSLPSSSTEAT